jgi:hypothetical protein
MISLRPAQGPGFRQVQEGNAFMRCKKTAIHKGIALRNGSDRREHIEKYWNIGTVEIFADYGFYLIENLRFRGEKKLEQYDAKIGNNRCFWVFSGCFLV